ncbi:adenomatous polyposis coli homolog [Aedes albopictus]|uniref:Protein zer-1 homolog-like C-terminal domain-containing protein n=1 Tax=Aedes albopictus TaxID=7160 RepID=A0ABM1YQE0_AEDAL|nr:adenomatous polyposis coli homolog [Aedes albopictus]
MQSTAAAAAATTATSDDDLRYPSSASALSPPDSSLDDLEAEYDDDLGDDGLDSGETGGVVKKPHFLDYDNKPPAGLEDQVVFVGQPRRSAAAAVVNGGSMDERTRENAAISQSVVEEGSSIEVPQEIRGRGTWPAAAGGSGQGAAKYAGRQNHSMYNDMSEICPKMECVYSLLSMLGSTNSLEMSTKFMELSKNRETCSALRRSGCIPLLVQIIHNDPNETARRNARQALNNVICCHPDDKAGRREVRVLKLIEQLIEYSDLLRDYTEESPPDIRDVIEDPEKHPIQPITTLMKISFDEEHRHAMCQLGALQTISTLIQMDHAIHGAKPSAPKCITMRRYAGMILTNLTFGDGNNKSLLCSNKNFMRALVAQIQSNSDELVQVTASVLRNLSWRADSVIKQTLSEIGTVKILTGAAMVCTIENTLKSILSALWNLSNHCPPNRSEFCEVEGALEFLIDMLTYEAPSKTMSVIENAGGILRNISSHIALREDYRRILRKKNCLKILLEQLKSPSLTVVSNACGTLGNLSGENYEDQKFLRENGAIPMLRSLIYSKHKMISNGSSMALKNLLKPPANSMMANAAGSPASIPIVRPATGTESQRSELPTLNVRKKKALEQELEEKFLPKGLREEKDICTSRVSPEEEDDEEPDEEGVVNPNSVHIRLVPNQEDEPEKPVNYSLKEEEAYQDYQETDIDQITDYSLRYAENQSGEDSDEDKSANYRRSNPTDGMGEMAEDTVKCYYTEGTPQIISSATSMSDLRVQLGGGSGAAATATASPKNGTVPKSNPIPIGGGGSGGRVVEGAAAGGGSSASGGQSVPKALGDTGCNTPDKPYNYCEEGTPDFSRDASLNVLELSAERDQKLSGKLPPEPESSDQPATPATPGGTQHTSKQVSFLNTADETPLMFSRTSSMGSLSSAEPICTADDKSSIISEFSRFASGVISPSELPDSPTQSMPHSPRRAGGLMAKPGPSGKREDAGGRPPTMEPTKSAFEDTVSKFDVENTPAVFSCATSLSNLSMDDKEDEESKAVVGGMVVKGPPVLPIPEGSASEDGESDRDDDFLLESCINMGMNVMARSAEDKKKKKEEEVVVPPPQEQEDLLQRYCTEDTPARLSKVNSNCDLSVLSMDSRNGHESDESSTVSAEQNDRLVEECIRSGMPKPKNPDGGGFTRKENPMVMMRNPAHMGPLYANDEVNNFYVEDSPCAHSTISALSDLTVASEAPNGVRNVYKISSLKGKQPQSQGGAPFAQAPAANGSLSSLSIESDNDDHLLDEAIAAGIGSNRAKQKQPTFQAVQNPLPPVNRMTAAAADANDSLDSIDSVDSNDPQSNSLLEQCIENGMKKLTEKHTEPGGFELRAGMNYGQLGPRPPAPAPDESIPDSERDYELLMECIQNGMPKGKNSQLAVDLTRNLQRLTISGQSSSHNNNPLVSNPKNVDTTPVVTKDVGATNVMSAGVVAVVETTTTVSGSSNTSGPGITTINNISTSTTPRSSITTRIINSSSITTTSITKSAQESAEQPETQEEHHSRQHPRQHLLASSITASNTSSMMGQSGFESLMERSNEFPASVAALALTGGLMSSSSAGCCTTNSSEMQMSNEFLVEEFTPASNNKHKDPDLMLKSVERLTQELVSTAEYLRTVSSSGGDRMEHNTWDDDVTTANDVSFPSLSVQAPMILHSCDDDDTATISDEVDSKALDALEEQTPMNENRPLPGFLNGSNEDLSKDELHFQLGGEVQHPMVGGHFTHGTDGLSFSTVSTLTNSTIIAMEATKVANNLQNMAIVESAELDLSKIHPPFGSDSILISDCSDSEMTFRNECRRITLPSGLVAKRALGHAFNDSLNSLNNLDSIGPPSIMDELMDSMISVASITSEVVDVDSGHAGTSDLNVSSGHSSLTLNSSLENLIKFSPTMNAGGKSTPISPKRAERRQAMKDRYKTYTIPKAELVDLNQTAEDEAIGSPDVMTPTPSNPSSPSPKKSSKERRQENKSRYETQVITSGSFLADRIASGYQECPRTPIASIIAKPVIFSPLTLHSPAPMSLERVLSPEVPPADDEDDDPVTYTIQEAQRRKSLEQKIPNISAHDQQTTITALPTVQPKTPLSSPSKVPIKTGSIKTAANPATPSAEPVKTVRGTKKPPYVSPYRKSVVSAPAVITRTPAVPGAVKKDLNAGPQATPKLRTQSSLVESSKTRPQPLKARSSIGLKRNSLEMNGNGSIRSSTSSSSSDVSRLHTRQPSCGAIGGTRTKVQDSPAPAPPPNLIRQGTFTKDEPTNPEVPVVTSAPSTPAKTLRKPGSMIPNSASSSRLTTIAKSRIVLHKSISMDASKTTPSTPTAGTPVGESTTPISSRFRLTSARTSLIDYKKPNSTASSRLSTPIGGSSEPPATPTSPGSMIPMRRKSAIAALPKRTNLTMKSNPDVLKGKLDGVRNAFVRTAASAVKTGTR